MGAGGQEREGGRTTKRKRDAWFLIFLKMVPLGSSHWGAVEMNLTSIHEDQGSIPGLAQWVRDPPLP